jgi:WD40 repeat protein
MNSSENDGTIELSTDSGSSNSRVILTSHSNMTTSQCSVGSSGILLVYGAPTALGSIHLKDGEMQLSMGLPFIGSEISMKPDSITLKVGPLTSLTLTPDGIVLSSGATKLALGVQGIKEEMGPITRSLGIMGHSLAAAESAVDVGVIGVNAKGPTGSFAFNATGQLSALLLTESADAIMSQKAALASTSS